LAGFTSPAWEVNKDRRQIEDWAKSCLSGRKQGWAHARERPVVAVPRSGLFKVNQHMERRGLLPERDDFLIGERLPQIKSWNVIGSRIL
jgi:hypothetical protein